MIDRSEGHDDRAEQGPVTTLREDVLAEFARVETDLLYTEKAHFCASEQFRVMHLVLGGFAAVASAATAATVLDKRTALSAVLTLAAAVATGTITFVKPLSLAERHVLCARRLGDLRFRLRQCKVLDGHAKSGITDGELRARVGVFTLEKQQFLEDAPTTGPLAFRRAQSKINAGHFRYED